jgi:hypothetical protein
MKMKVFKKKLPPPVPPKETRGYAANLPDRKVIHVPVISTFSASLQTAAVTVPRAPWEVQA